MRSHEYEFEWRGLMRVLLAPVVLVVAVALLLHLCVGILPAPRHLFDIERTIITHQVEACMRGQEADVVLLGDSSGLMGVDTVVVGDDLGLKVLNLGTISFLGLREYSEMLELYVRNHPAGLKGAVLFLHPEALRRAAPEPYYVSFLESVMAGEDHRHEDRLNEGLEGMLGLDRFRSRIWVRLVPPALNKEFGTMYGFTRDLDRYMTEHAGSLIDPTRLSFKGNPEYRLAPSLQRESKRFRSLLPPGVLLGVGVTPAPGEFVLEGHEEVHRGMLLEWADWLGADLVLTNLPATLPARYFSTVAHLSAEGRERYSHLVAEELGKVFR